MCVIAAFSLLVEALRYRGCSWNGLRSVRRGAASLANCAAIPYLRASFFANRATQASNNAAVTASI
jgi:hypothetical protein